MMLGLRLRSSKRMRKSMRSVEVVSLLLAGASVDRGLCDGFVTCPEESYRVSVCDKETSIQSNTSFKYEL
jgi:hypothetical protein